MTFLKVLHPLIRQRTPAIQKNVLFNSFKRLDSNKQSSVVKSARRDVDTNVKPLGEKIKDTTKTASYLGVILVGVGVTGALLYAVFRELFSSTSSNNIYSAAVEKCKNDTRVQDKLGLPITAFGAETRRRRRQHVSHVKFLRDGKQCISMVFHLKGSFHQGLVQLEKTEVCIKEGIF